MIWKTPKEMNETEYVKKVYQQIISLAILAHASYIFIFAYLSFTWLSVYNVASVSFYCLMLYTTNKGLYRLAVSAIHLEVSIFVFTCTVLSGWETGMHLYLVAMMALVYFCPFNRKYIPYCFSALEIVLFLSLKILMMHLTPYYTLSEVSIDTFLYLYNAVISFAIILYAAYSSDVSAAVTKKLLQDENKSLSNIANFDQLTGLLSRYSFLQKAQEYPFDTLFLAIGDIDNFKHVNDTYGHNCGDYILRKTAELMRICCGHHVDLCRWGGEEFVFLFHDLPMEEVKQKMQEICDQVAQYPYQYNGYSLRITITFGISSSSGVSDITSLVNKADKKLYLGKENGKNQVVA